MTFQTRLLPVLLALPLALSGCASLWGDDEPAPEREFGSSVRNMIRQQTYDPEAGSQPDANGGLDGDKASDTLKAYRDEKAKKAPLNPIGVILGQ